MSTPITNTVHTSTPRAHVLAWLGITLILAAMMAKATTSIDPFPGFSGDPTLISTTILGLTPKLSILVDLVMTLGAALAIFASGSGSGLSQSESNPRESLAGAFALLVGVVGVAFHASITGDPKAAFVGMSWMAALVAGYAAWSLRSLPGIRLALAAGALALVVTFAARSVVQYTLEQPAAYDAFRANKANFLASQGWVEGSPNALAYERRVSQREASAWFGLANPLATYGAGFATAFAAISLALLKHKTREGESSRNLTIMMSLLALVAISLVFMAGSKGGYAVLGLGLVLAFVGVWRASRGQTSPTAIDKYAGSIGPALILLALVAIFARGLIGERIGELSLYFRWFYIQGAARAFVESPWVGTSPTGFKDAYMRLKPALSPEDVTSPHSVLFDAIATLGVFGFGIVALLFAAAAGAGRSLLTRATTSSMPRDNDAFNQASLSQANHDAMSAIALRVTFLGAAIGSLFAAWLEAAAVTPEGAAVRIAAILAAPIISVHLYMVARRVPWAMPVAFGACALVILVHVQIELTPTLGSSAALFAVLVGLSSGWNRAHKSGQSHQSKVAQGSARFSLSLWLGVLACVAAFVIGGVRYPSVYRWENSLRDALAAVEPLPRWNEELQELAKISGTLSQQRNIESSQRASTIASALAAELLPDMPKLQYTLQDLAKAYQSRRIVQMDSALKLLAPAISEGAKDVETARAASALALRIWMERSATANSGSTKADFDKALQIAIDSAKANPGSSLAWSWVATVCRAGQGSSQGTSQGTNQESWLSLNDQSGLPNVSGSNVTGSNVPGHGSEVYPSLAARALTFAAFLAPHEPTHAAWLAEEYARLGDAFKASEWAKEALGRNAMLRLDPIRKLEETRATRLRGML